MLRALLALVVTCLVLAAAPVAPADATPAVERAQRRLNQLGCDSGPADGAMGERTRSAVLRFQSRHRLSQTGNLNNATTRRLYADDARRCDVRPVPPRSGTGRRIVVSQRQNWVWLVASGGRVVGQSGMIDNPGELGTGWKKVGSYCGRSAKIRRNTDTSGALVLEHFTRFAPCGIGFHRIPTHRSGSQIHPAWLVGTNLRQSHGCVRLPKAFAARLWDFGRVGTRVRVVRG
ncbi:L,D-transpeptidase family protein [Nocardioides antri]|uniref:Murein L,D-transpeptidase n=1 Tax=Nocardioides antri TaxID=2607659 RepID=A0A5B1M3I1_9ACTN|nr:L,D-transpeptidase family protein [Nocardioides antri]KAA1426709.1 murein L,D-transpeptidase [Nocardioides antri]